MKRRDFLKLLSTGAIGGAIASHLPNAVFPPIEAGLTGSSVVTNGCGSAEISVGDVFTIAGRFSVNPVTRKPTGHLQQFVVTSVTNSGDEIGISPQIIIDGAYQTTTGAPAPSANKIPSAHANFLGAWNPPIKRERWERA